MKRFVTRLYDACWQVGGQETVAIGGVCGPVKNTTRLTYRYAEFYGDGARGYAVAHARMLNSLPKEKQPR